MAGRPKLKVDVELLKTNLEFGFKQQEIADFLNVSLRKCKSLIKDLCFKTKIYTLGSVVTA